MKISSHKRVLGTIAAGLALSAAIAAPPAKAADTTTTFVVTGGALQVSAPGTASLTGINTGVSATSGTLGSTTVTDARGSLLGAWTAKVSSTDFTTGAASADETIGKGSVTYLAGLATATTGTGVFTPGQVLAEDLSIQRNAYTATAVVGNNSVTWDPTLNVTIPSDVVAGTYSGTITHSVA
jgi:hypothetical protein